MSRVSGHVVWLPPVVTLTAWILLIFAVDAVSSKTMADLVGLLSLLVSPFVYREMKSLILEMSGNQSEVRGDRLRTDA